MNKERRIEIGRRRRTKTRARIVAAAFDLLGAESGLYARIEDIADRAGITRPTFYNHFANMADLREAVTYELTHDFLTAVTTALAALPDPRERAAAAIRFYLGRVREDPAWGWSVINLSANGLIFGAETYMQAQRTVQEGIHAGFFALVDSATGRDVVLGSTLAAIGTVLREAPEGDQAARVASAILRGLGVSADDAQVIVARPLPPLT